MLCGFYRMTPHAIGDLTPGESRTLLDAIDWANDRDWERSIFLRTTDHRAARDMLRLSYPRFRVEHRDRIVKITHAPSARKMR
jgi:hypothetical protein